MDVDTSLCELLSEGLREDAMGRGIEYDPAGATSQILPKLVRVKSWVKAPRPGS